MGDKKIKVTVWHEFIHEKEDPTVAEIYPNGIHYAIKDFLDNDKELEVRAVSLDMPNQGLDDELLCDTDVLLWWGHVGHHLVENGLVDKIAERVYRHGMGFIALHSAHHSKPFKKIVGCTGDLVFGEEQKELIWNLAPTHPIAEGIPDHFELVEDELYCEPFYIPTPDALVFGGWYEYGGMFRSGCCFNRGLGKVFYFQPGHETCTTYHNPYVQKIINNAVHWAAPANVGVEVPEESCTHQEYRFFERK